jgi:hypothetical protein
MRNVPQKIDPMIEESLSGSLGLSLLCHATAHTKSATDVNGNSSPGPSAQTALSTLFRFFMDFREGLGDGGFSGVLVFHRCESLAGLVSTAG